MRDGLMRLLFKPKEYLDFTAQCLTKRLAEKNGCLAAKPTYTV